MKLFSKIAALSVGVAMAVGVGVALANDVNVESVRADDQTGTINFGSASGSTNVNAASVTGDDSLGNTWTITTVASQQSFTPNASYAQIGSSKKPATSITFTTTLEASQTISAFSAKFGGFSGTAGTITLKVGDTSVGTGSLNTTSDVVVSASDTTQIGTVLTVTVTGISKGVKAYYISYSYTESSGDTFSVIYNKNETSSRPVEGMPSNITGLNDGDTATLTGTPTRWGYTFLGWGASASATETISSVTIDGANETVFALWQEDHSVAGAWSDSPYTVAQARTAIDNNKNLTSVYAEGIISQVDSYNSTYKSIQYWISDDGTTTNQFEVYSGKGLNGADFSSVNDVEVGAHVIINGNIKKYNSTYEFDKSSKQIVYDAPSTGDIEVTFQPAVFLGVGDSGTYTASTTATNPTYSFSCAESSVLSVSSNGAYSAVAAGSATVRVDVTSSDGNGYKEVAVTVVEVKTVSEAYDIAAALASGATTDYSIKVTGAISSLDADGKARAINFTDGSQVIEVFFGGGNADYTTVTSSGVIGSKVTVFGKVQNYSGTYELKDITLAGVVGGDADSYAAGAYKSLDSSCETGPAAVTEDQWTAVSNGYSALSSTDQAKFRDADLTPHGENVVNWVDRYERIVANTELTNFMSLSNIAGRLAFDANGIVDSDSAMIVVVIAAVTSLTSIAVLLVIKRRKTLIK